MFIVGLTGGIGSGKSSVAECFARLGITVVNADTASRKVVEPGTPALQAIADHFGNAMLLPDGGLDRAALRQRIFSDPAAKDWLEKLLHPLIAQWIDTRLTAAPGPYAILESPLLLETAQHRRVNRVLVVDVAEALQIARASTRDANNAAQIKAIIASQLPRSTRLARADDVIDNSGALRDLAPQVEALHRKYLAMAGAEMRDER
ncbi:MAG: dephospho-CoA kinase [Gammaproteobacteria bacterium BRH_c0]|nr:MAG: dephospho-CoA kinase [Gammaproteobacteria bacterium BRH_c0]